MSVFPSNSNEEMRVSEAAREQVMSKIPKYRSFQIVLVINDSFSAEELPLIEAKILRLNHMHLVKELLPILPPLSADYNHLKRINQGKVLIKIIFDGISNDEELIEKIGSILKEEPKIIHQKVPKCKPKTRRQFEFSKKYWPVSFHKDALMESKLGGTFFTEKELETIRNLFMQAEMKNAALIFSLESGSIICEGRSNPAKILSHPIIECINILSEKQTRSDKNDQQYYATGSHIHFNLKNRFIFLGLEAMLAEEPCTMCAMALVHCRVKRVFFGKLNTRNGALSSKWQLQDSPSLNHHLEVYQVIEDHGGQQRKGV